MKTTIRVGAFVVVALFLAAPVQATTLLSYDFEGLTPGGLSGQDGWSISGDWSNVTVAQGSGADSTLVASGNASGPTGLHRAVDSLTFGSADTAVEQRVWVSSSVNSIGGLLWSGVDPKLMLFGVSTDKGSSQSYFRDATGEEHYGDSRTASDWYDMKLVMDFSTTGGLATLYARDVTLGETSYVQDTLLTNINMGLTPSDGVYTANGISFRIDVNGSVDNFSVSTASIPEPGTLTLLTAGVLGLLAYAWRKRN